MAFRSARLQVVSDAVRSVWNGFTEHSYRHRNRQASQPHLSGPLPIGGVLRMDVEELGEVVELSVQPAMSEYSPLTGHYPPNTCLRTNASRTFVAHPLPLVHLFAPGQSPPIEFVCFLIPINLFFFANHINRGRDVCPGATVIEGNIQTCFFRRTCLKTTILGGGRMFHFLSIYFLSI